MPLISFQTLELQPSRKLEDARAADADDRIGLAGGLSKASIQASTVSAQIGDVEEVEDLANNLQRNALAKLDVLRHAQVVRLKRVAEVEVAGQGNGRKQPAARRIFAREIRVVIGYQFLQKFFADRTIQLVVANARQEIIVRPIAVQIAVVCAGQRRI